MSYKLNKTNGDLLIELVDGRIDTSSTNITLVGKNYQGFGESINENFIKLLENFANSTQPSKPLRGQLWYDTAEGRLKIYNGTEFKSTDTTIYASTRPTSLVEGDIWIDGSNNQLYFYDGIQEVLVGPQYTKTQLQSGHFVETVKDSTGINKVIVKFYINGAVVGIYAKEAFTPFPTISGFTNLSAGFNISSAYSTFKWLGTATNAENLIDNLGTIYDPLTLFLRKDRATGDSTAGPITINNNSGLNVAGSSTTTSLYTSGTDAVLKNFNGNLRIDLNNSTPHAMWFSKSNRRVGINNDNPNANLHIGSSGSNGDVIIEGNLTVRGTTTTIDTTELRVNDFQIQLAIPEDSSGGLARADLDDAGIIIESTDGSIDWTWNYATTAWTTGENINLENDLASYRIDNAEILSKTTLGSTVLNSSLTSLGTLTTLTVDDINLNGTRITCTNTLEISAVGTVDFLSNPKLTNVGTPTSARVSALGGGSPAEDDNDFVATKGYVDGELSAVTEVMGMDITGLGSGAALQTNVGIMLEELYPAATKANGGIARIHTSAIAATTDPIDVNSNVSKTFTAVDSAGVQNVSVVGDFSVSSPTATVSLTVTRTIMEYKVVAGTWTYQTTTASAV
jgi:hypothetical protein